MKQGKGQKAIRLVENLLIIYRDKFREPVGYLKDRWSMESITITGRIPSRGSVMVLAKKSEESVTCVKVKLTLALLQRSVFYGLKKSPAAMSIYKT